MGSTRGGQNIITVLNMIVPMSRPDTEPTLGLKKRVLKIGTRTPLVEALHSTMTWVVVVWRMGRWRGWRVTIETHCSLLALARGHIVGEMPGTFAKAFTTLVLNTHHLGLILDTIGVALTCQSIHLPEVQGVDLGVALIVRTCRVLIQAMSKEGPWISVRVTKVSEHWSNNDPDNEYKGPHDDFFSTNFS